MAASIRPHILERTGAYGSRSANGSPGTRPQCGPPQKLDAHLVERPAVDRCIEGAGGENCSSTSFHAEHGIVTPKERAAARWFAPDRAVAAREFDPDEVVAGLPALPSVPDAEDDRQVIPRAGQTAQVVVGRQRWEPRPARRWEVGMSDMGEQGPHEATDWRAGVERLEARMRDLWARVAQSQGAQAETWRAVAAGLTPLSLTRDDGGERDQATQHEKPHFRVAPCT